MSQYDELKRLAEALLASDDHADFPGWMAASDAFDSAAGPAAILALIAENERLQGCEDVLRQLASYCGCGGYNAPEVDPEVFAKKIMDGINILNDPLVQLAEKRAAERDQLKAENEALRKDSERYQWLSEKFGVTKLPCAIERILDGEVYVADGKASIDAAIDAAMGKGEQS